MKTREIYRKIWLIVFTIGLTIFGLNHSMAQLGPGGVGNANGENGQPRLTLWLDASTLSLSNGADVSNWTDLSGNANHATQATTVNMPIFSTNIIGGNPVVRFQPTAPNRTQTWLNYSGMNLVGSPYSIFAVAARRSLGFKLVLGGTSTNGNQNLHWGWRDNTQFTQAQYGNDISRTLDVSTANTFSIFSTVRNNTTSPWGRAIFQNSNLLGATENNITLLTDNPGAAIGRFTTNYYDIDVAEIIQYSSALNAAQRIIIENYLAQKYSVGLSTNIQYTNSTYNRNVVGIGTTDGLVKHIETSGTGGGILLKEINGSLNEPNEFVFAGHDGTAHGINNTNLPTIIGVTLSDRWQRIFYIERRQAGTLNAGSTDVRLTFDFAGTGITLATDKVYYLLYRSGTSGDFTEVTGGTGVASEGKVSINITNTNFSSGYYTLVKSDQEIRTWYSLNDGAWNNHNTWSLKPTEPDNLLSEIPGIMDRVVILSNRTVTVTENSTQSGVLDVVNGRIDFGTTTGSSFSKITGQADGTIRLAADNFPSGDASEFANGATGGTVEYYGGTYNLTTQRVYNNMVVNLTAGNTLSLLANYTLNGNFNVERGNFSIGNSSSTAIVSIDIAKNLEVYTGAQISVGSGNTIGTYSIPDVMPPLGQYHSIFHQVRIGGGMVNNGTVNFTNLGAPNYGQFANNGAATVTFYGASNALVELNNTTNFYNLIIDKGVDRTFVLTIDAQNVNHFRLYGPNNVGRRTGGIFTGANPEIRKALWIRTGTLKLLGNIAIPSLSEGFGAGDAGGNGDYAVPANGSLWIADAGVRVYSTARTASPDLIGGTLGVIDGTSNQAMSVYGEFRISNGFFSTRNSAGFIFWSDASATLRIEGGICDVAQFRSAHGGAGGNTSIVMTGGEMYVRGNRTVGTINPEGGGEPTAAYPIFGIIDPNGVFSMSGGTVHINAVTGDNVYGSNGICITTTQANHNITGGTFNINVNGNDNVDILSTNNLNSITVSRQNAANTVRVYLNSDLALSGSLTLNANTEFIARREWGGFNGISRNLSVAGSLISNAGSIYRTRGNTTTFTGNGTALLNGDITELFHNLSVTGGIRTLTATLNTVRVQNNLSVSAGATLNIQPGKELVVRGNLTNSGIIGGDGKIRISERGRVAQINVTNGGSFTAVPTISLVAPPFGGTQATAIPVFDGIPAAGNALPLVGVIVTNTGSGYTAAPAVTITPASGATAASVIGTTHELGGNNNGIFSNLELNETTAAALAGNEYSFLTANFTISNQLTITAGILDLRTNKIRLNGTLGSETHTDYGNTRMLRTAGNHSDGGFERYVNANQLYLYPFGTKAPGGYVGDVNRYTPLRATFTNVTDDGYVQVNPVGSELGTLNPGDANEKALQYYWRMRNSDFSSTPTVNNMFNYDERDVRTPPAEASYRIGKVIGVVRTNVAGITQAQDLMNYPNNLLEEGEFTAGHQQRFLGSVQVFYLRQNGNWRTNATWSFTRGGGAATDYPRAGDIAVIRRFSVGYNGLVEITNAETCAKVIFDDENGWSSGCPRIWFSNAAAFGSNFSVVTVAETHQGGVLNGETHGAVIQYDLQEGYAGQFPTGDFGDFNRYPNALVIYTKEGATATVTLSAQATEYPQVWFDPPNNRIFILPDAHVTFNGMVIMPYGQTLRMNTGANSGATFKKRLNIGHPFGAGYFEFAGNATANQTVIAETNINLYNNGQLRINSPVAGGRKHKLSLMENITMETGTVINLGDGNMLNTNVELELVGNGANSLTGAGTTTVNLSHLTMNKGDGQTQSFSFDRAFTLNGPTNGTSLEKALQLQNGTLILNNSGININLSTGGENFVIPSTAGLRITAGTANVTGANTGIFLDGFLHVNGGNMLLDGGAGVNNYILYSSSGNANIQVSNGTLTVGSQVRSSTLNELGILRYTQTNGTVLIGKNAAPTLTRPIFEVRNPNSRFIYTGGSFTIARSRSSASMADLYLTPAVSTVLGTIAIGDDNTPIGQTIDIQSEIALRNLTVGTVARATTARLKVNGLTLNGNLNINTGSIFNGSNLNLWMLGNITNNGAANLSTDTLYYVGATQTQTGNVIAKHVMANPQTSVTLQASSSLEVDGDLYINSGQLIDGGNSIVLRGNVTNNASHASSNPLLGGIKFEGSALQRVYGTGQFGRIEVDNINGVQLENSMSLNNHLTLTNGILQLQSNKLTLGVNANILGSGFGDNKMIAVGGGDFLQGIQKTFPIVASAIPTNPYNDADPAYTYGFIFPIGVDNGTVKKYTPVNIRVASSATQATINLYPVNRKHITFDATQTDVLQYYWIVNSSNTSNFSTLIRSHYLQTDVVGNEAAYIGARLFDDSWAKYEEGPGIVVVDEANNWINFVYQGVDNISGEYTAGIQPHIPDVVPLFISTKSGNWEDADTWVRDDGGLVPAGGPVGQRVRITTGHTVTVTQNFRRAYKTTINGRLDLGTTINHILGQIQVVGYVEGTGTLALQTSSLPAGNFDAFCNCGGGTLEFGGATGGGVPARTQFNNLTIAGSALWIMPSNDVNICGNLRMQGSSTLKMSGVAASYRYVNVNGSVFIKNTATWDQAQRAWVRLRGGLEKDNSAFLSTNFSTHFIELDGTQSQTIDGTFTGVNMFNNLRINNPTTIPTTGQIDVRTFLYLINGRVQNSTINKMNVILSSGNGLNTISNGVIEGALSVNLRNTSAIKYLPVGKNNIKKFINILDLPVAVGNWTGEYFSASPTSAGMPHTSMLAPIQTVSQSEYWRITGPNLVGSRIQLTLNGTSDVAAGVGNINNLRILYWTGPPNNRWEVAGGGASVVGPISNGTITSGNFTFNGGVQYFTLGAVETVVVPTAQITSASTTICAGETFNLTISLTGGSPWQIQYSDGVTTTGWITVNTSPHVIPLTPTTTTTYTLTAVRTQAGPVNGVVYGSPVTATVRPLPTVFTVGGGGFICNTETVSVTLDDSEIGFTYELYRDGLLLGNQQAGTGNAISFTGIDVAGTYTIRAFNNLRPSCTLWMSGSAAVTVGSSAFAQITSVLSDNPACEGLPVQFEITLNGTPPFTFSMADNFGNTWNNVVVTLAQLTGVGPYTYTFTLPDQYPTWVAPALPNAYIYNVTNITDSSGCGVGSIGAGVTVNVYKLPETGPQYHIPNTFGE